VFRWIPWLISDPSGAAIGCFWTGSAVRICADLGCRGNVAWVRHLFHSRSRVAWAFNESIEELPSGPTLAKGWFRLPLEFLTQPFDGPEPCFACRDRRNRQPTAQFLEGQFIVLLQPDHLAIAWGESLNGGSQDHDQLATRSDAAGRRILVAKLLSQRTVSVE